MITIQIVLHIRDLGLLRELLSERAQCKVEDDHGCRRSSNRISGSPRIINESCSDDDIPGTAEVVVYRDSYPRELASRAVWELQLDIP